MLGRVSVVLRSTLLLAAGALGACAGVQAEQRLGIGPYVLEMSNAQASKAGLSDCERYIRSTIRCFGSVDALGSKHKVQIDFDAHTKRIEAMETVIAAPHGEKDFPDMARDLQLGTCAANRSENDGWSCYSRPYNARLVQYDNGIRAKRWQKSKGPFFVVTARTNAFAAKSFFNIKPREATEQQQLRRFANGK